MKIGELAVASGVSRDTLRFYEKRGLIRPARGTNGYRDYPEEAAIIVSFVRMAQKLGFTLSEIGAELPALDGGSISQQRIVDILSGKLDAIDRRIADMQDLRARLATMLEHACPLAIPDRMS